MDIFSIITLFGGLAFFLYGMRIMSDGLEKSANNKLNANLKKVTGNPLIAIAFGAGLTIAVQSSSAVTVMLVGLVNSGVIEFSETIGILMGSNIGTTLTAWILSLAGIESDTFFLNLLKPANFSPLFAVVGVIMVMMGKKDKTKNIGSALLGFAVLMFGMNIMSEAMEPLTEMPEFTKMLTSFENPLFAVLIGALFTSVIQSSAASVAILQAFSLSGGLTYGMAIPVIMGLNIGTCVTAVLASFGVNNNAKKVAFTHLMIKVIGTIICLVPYCILDAVFNFAFVDMEISPVMIAVIHSIFNIVVTIILFPFSKQLVKLTNKLLPDRKHIVEEVLLDDRLLTVPSIAVQKAFDATKEMCQLSKDAFLQSVKITNEYDEQYAAKISEIEERLDWYEDQISTYMMKVSKYALTDDDSRCVAKILHTIDDFERIGDHALTVMKIARDLYLQKETFSEEAVDEVAKLGEAIYKILTVTEKSFVENDPHLAVKVEPLGQVIDNMVYTIKRNHVERLRMGKCSKELGFRLGELLTCYERVAHHCSNTAVAIIESHHGTFDTHKYLKNLKDDDSGEFNQMYKKYSDRFNI